MQDLCTILKNRRIHMSMFKKILALVCVLSLMLGMLAGCGEKDPAESTGSSEPTGNTTVTGQNSNYVVNIRSAGGIALSGVTVLAYADAGLTDMKGYGQSNADGQAVLSLPSGGDYYVTLTSAPDGYQVESSYHLTAAKTDIVLTSQVIADTNISNVTYKLGDIMHDFTVTDTEGNEVTLSKLLEEKEMVLINFWYSTCNPCVSEFPYMDAVYQQYSDKVAVVALNHSALSGDSVEGIKAFHDNFYDVYDSDEATTGALSITMAREDLGMQSAFADLIGGYPTSIVVDRYGMICMVEVGALTSAEPFTYLFEAFTGDEYVQTIYESVDELVPDQRPTAVMPSSDEVAAVLNGSSITVSYAPETDPESADITWPFVIGQKDGSDCIYASNAGVASSFATLYANVTLEAGQALAIDYYASSETNADCLYILIDRNDIYQISGEGTGWKTCYPWVATEAGEYEVAFCYYKDSSDDAGDDTVYLKNFRVVDVADIDAATYIPRFAATNLKADGFGYENYITPVLNENDGYYHVNSADGPLLLANLMMATQFSNTPIYTHAANGDITIDGVDYYNDLVSYCSYASNSQIYSMCPVNEELKQLLMKVTACIGLEQSENEWLQICEYYDVYGTGGVQLENPIAGLCPDSAYTAQLGTNEVYYDRMLMPRGVLYRFVPTKSGAYRITSNSEYEVEGWIFTRESCENREAVYTYDGAERMYYSDVNISMVYYMEAGKEYFIDIAFYDVYQTGGFTFDIKYEAASMELFVSCAPGPFTYKDENTYEIVTGGIDVALGSDGYYHELLSDGSLGSVIYADFVSPTEIFFSHSIVQMLNSNAFNFAMSEGDQYILDFYASYEAENFNGGDFESCMKDYWGEDFEAYWALYQVDEVLAGTYHGSGEDMGGIISKYVKLMETSGDKEGCVAVTEELAQVLQMLMDKFTFKDVEHGWTKLCYYYDYFGPDANR